MSGETDKRMRYRLIGRMQVMEDSTEIGCSILYFARNK